MMKIINITSVKGYYCQAYNEKLMNIKYNYEAWQKYKNTIETNIWPKKIFIKGHNEDFVNAPIDPREWADPDWRGHTRGRKMSTGDKIRTEEIMRWKTDMK